MCGRPDGKYSFASETKWRSAAVSHAELCVTHLYVEEVYEITVFVEVTKLWVGEPPRSRGHHRPIQWCFLELFVIFVYKKKKKKNLFQNDLNECIFCFMYMNKRRCRGVNRRVFCAGRGGNVSSVWWPSVSFSFVLLFCFVHFFKKNFFY